MSVSSVSPNPWAMQLTEGVIDSPAEAIATWINENQITDLTQLSRPQMDSLLQRLNEINASNNVSGLGELVRNLGNVLENQPSGSGGTDILDTRLAVLSTLAGTTNDSSNPLSKAADQAQANIDSIINNIVLDFFAGADAETVLEDD
jgi:hypothetical protein